VLVRSAAAAAALLLAACHHFVPPEPELPSVIRQCETYTTRICGTWERESGDTYRAVWDDGATASIRVVRFTFEEIVVRREDDGQNVDFTATYAGTVRGRSAAGAVVWNAGESTRSGTWEAEW
jgi:hypothetical protein